MKKIVVFGAGIKGRKVIEFFVNSVNISIVAVCDNDKEKWGKKINEIEIKPPNVLLGKLEADAIIVAINDNEEVYKWCIENTNINTYKEIKDFVAETVYIDITSGCNARCLYCVTGKENREKTCEFSFMTFDDFEKIYRHLISTDIITNETELGLYNWGEPFLNNDCIKIFSFLSTKGQQYTLSTNASIYREAKDKNTYTFCKRIYFSMPGFSQSSYDRIHGFSFEKIRNNIEKLFKDMIMHGFTGEGIVSAHLYKFSINELAELTEWAEKLGLKVLPYYPYLNGNSLFENYFSGKLDEDYLDNINQDLFINNWDKLREKRPQNYTCQIGEWLALNEKGEIVLCCQTDKNCDSFYGWGSIFEIDSYLSYKNLKKIMLDSKSCKICRQYGIDYAVVHNLELPVGMND